VPTAAADPILGLSLAFIVDTNANKVDLGVGAYRTDEGKPYVLDVVREVDLEIAKDMSLNKEYLPIDGYPVFTKCAQDLLFGAENPHVKAGNIVTVQSISGTGALRIAFEFVAKYLRA
jgi:aspartate/tyrosine/aromatic aminotransferase